MEKPVSWQSTQCDEHCVCWKIHTLQDKGANKDIWSALCLQMRPIPRENTNMEISQDVQVMRGDTNFRLLVKKKHECSNRIT